VSLSGSTANTGATANQRTPSASLDLEEWVGFDLSRPTRLMKRFLGIGHVGHLDHNIRQCLRIRRLWWPALSYGLFYYETRTYVMM
jgi:hypothetical protein